jgi:hypothetical protein
VTDTAADPASQVAEKFRDLATTTRTSILLGADLIDFQGKKIDVQRKQLELLGLEKDELRAQIARVKDRRTA